MSRALVRLRAALVALGVLAAGAVMTFATPTPAQAAGCTAPQVAVVVDFTHWGGSTRIGCVAWRSGLTGVDALLGAGFALTGTRQYGTSFICRINGLPDASHESCNSTPPYTAYWDYWHADPGQSSWSYSNLGVASYHPHPGSAEAWAFGDSATPAVSPGAVLPRSGGPSTTSPKATAPRRTLPSTPRSSTPRPSTPRPSTSRPSIPNTSRPAQRRSTAGPGPLHPGGPGDPRITGTASASSASGPASRSGGAATRGTSSPATASAAHDPSSSGSTATRLGGVAAGASTPSLIQNSSSTAAAGAHGSPWPTILAIVVLALLAAGAGGYARQRRAGRTRG